MDDMQKASIWYQFGASIDYLIETMAACPDELWRASLWEHSEEIPEFSQFWYRAYHTLFWLDCYLYGTEDGFLPPSPFELIEQDDDGPLPVRPYTQQELLTYAAACREKCRTTIDAQTDETARRLHSFPWGEVPFFELLIYNLRHVQEHTAQLNLFLGQKVGPSPDYPIKVRD